MRPM